MSNFNRYNDSDKVVFCLLGFIICFVVVTLLTFFLLTGHNLTFEYILLALKKSHFSFSKLPFYFKTSLIIGVLLSSVIVITLFNIVLKSFKKVNSSLTYFAKWRDIKRFKKFTSITDKTGMVLGVYNLGLIPHSIFTKAYVSKNRIIRKIGVFFLYWKKIPILNIFINYKILRSEKASSLLCYAPTGTGKTTSIVLPNMRFVDKDNLIINDPKGEIYKLTSAYREKTGSKIIKLEWAGEKSDKWNPLDISNFKPYENTDQFFVRISEYCNMLAETLIRSGEKDVFWNNSAKSLFATISLYLVYYNYYQNKSTNICEIKSFCNNLNNPTTEEEEKGFRDEDMPFIEYKAKNMASFLKSLLERPEYKTAIASQAISRIIDLINKHIRNSYQQRETFLQTIESYTTAFSTNPRVAINTSENTISFKEIREGINGQSITLYLITPPADESYGILSGLFIEFLYKSLLLDGYKDNKNHKNLRIIIDELAFFPPIKAITEAPAITRSLAIYWVFLCQDANQVIEKWGKENYQVLHTNSVIKTYLCQNNSKVADEISNTIGITEMKDIRKGIDGKERIIKQEKLVNPAEIRSLKNKQILDVEKQGNRPVLCDQAFYFRYPELKIGGESFE